MKFETKPQSQISLSLHSFMSFHPSGIYVLYTTRSKRTYIDNSTPVLCLHSYNLYLLSSSLPFLCTSAMKQIQMLSVLNFIRFYFEIRIFNVYGFMLATISTLGVIIGIEIKDENQTVYYNLSLGIRNRHAFEAVLAIDYVVECTVSPCHQNYYRLWK